MQNTWQMHDLKKSKEFDTSRHLQAFDDKANELTGTIWA